MTFFAVLFLYLGVSLVSSAAYDRPFYGSISNRGHIDAEAAALSLGEDAEKGQFPWVVSVEATNFERSWPLCGGILIARDWVLTAAHCLDSEKPEWLWVVTGEYNKLVEEGTEQRLHVDYILQHPDYTYWQKPYQNDVGLIHLKTPAVIDKFTNIGPLASERDNDLSNMCKESGWGRDSSTGKAATILKVASVSLQDTKLCHQAYHSEPDHKALCAGASGVGACIGDNGGGLLCQSRTSGRKVLKGLMSWREGACAIAGKPGVYMDIAKYRPWISSHINARRRYYN